MNVVWVKIVNVAREMLVSAEGDSEHREVVDGEGVTMLIVSIVRVKVIMMVSLVKIVIVITLRMMMMMMKCTDGEYREGGDDTCRVVDLRTAPGTRTSYYLSSEGATLHQFVSNL